MLLVESKIGRKPQCDNGVIRVGGDGLCLCGNDAE